MSTTRIWAHRWLLIWKKISIIWGYLGKSYFHQIVYWDAKKYVQERPFSLLRHSEPVCTFEPILWIAMRCMLLLLRWYGMLDSVVWSLLVQKWNYWKIGLCTTRYSGRRNLMGVRNRNITKVNTMGLNISSKHFSIIQKKIVWKLR